MERQRWKRLATYSAAALVLFLTFGVLLVALEQRRTKAEMGALVSALFRDEVLKDYRDLGAGREVQIIVRREAHSAENWKSRWTLLRDQHSQFPQASLTTRISFFLSNVSPADISTELHLPKGAQSIFLASGELERFGRNEFQSRFPNNVGFFVVSQIGLNPSKSEALFYVDHYCSGLCGGGGYVLMQKTNGVWHVVDVHGTWIS